MLPKYVIDAPLMPKHAFERIDKVAGRQYAELVIVE